MSQPPDLEQMLSEHMARIRKDVLPFWAGTQTASMISDALDDAVDAIISGDDASMRDALTTLQRYCSTVKTK